MMRVDLPLKRLFDVFGESAQSSCGALPLKASLRSRHQYHEYACGALHAIRCQSKRSLWLLGLAPLPRIPSQRLWLHPLDFARAHVLAMMPLYHLLPLPPICICRRGRQRGHRLPRADRGPGAAGHGRRLLRLLLLCRGRCRCWRGRCGLRGCPAHVLPGVRRRQRRRHLPARARPSAAHAERACHQPVRCPCCWRRSSPR